MIVVDTSYIVGLYRAGDAHNRAARGIQGEVEAGRWGSMMLLEYVFLETMSVLLQQVGPAAATEVGKTLLRGDEIQYVPCSGLFDRAWAEFQRQPGTRLSLTDITIAQYALEHAEGRVLSFDQELRRVPGLKLLPATTGTE